MGGLTQKKSASFVHTLNGKYIFYYFLRFKKNYKIQKEHSLDKKKNIYIYFKNK